MAGASNAAEQQSRNEPSLKLNKRSKKKRKEKKKSNENPVFRFLPFQVDGGKWKETENKKGKKKGIKKGQSCFFSPRTRGQNTVRNKCIGTLGSVRQGRRCCLKVQMLSSGHLTR